MATDGHLPGIPTDDVDPSTCAIHRLTRPLAAKHTRRLLAIHNSIPYVSWQAEDLLADAHGDRQFIDKWRHSTAVIDQADHQPVGLMIAYVRQPWDAFPERSLYLHRGAILDKHRRKGVGRMLFEHYTLAPAEPAGPEWLTLQTNATPSNEWVIRFYEDLGFQRGNRVVYADKKDYLMYKRWV